MKHTLETLYQHIKKRFAYIASADIEQYCKESTLPEPERVSGFHYGKGSLKWFIYMLRDTTEQEYLEQLFYIILLEKAVLRLSFQDLQYDIWSFPATNKYTNLLKRPENMPDVRILPRKKHKGYTFVLNNTEYNLTSLIFKHVAPDCILFYNPAQFASGIIMNAGSNIVSENWDLVFKYLRHTAPFGAWIEKGNPINLFMHPGLDGESKYRCFYTGEQLFEVIKENLE